MKGGVLVIKIPTGGKAEVGPRAEKENDIEDLLPLREDGEGPTLIEGEMKSEEAVPSQSLAHSLSKSCLTINRLPRMEEMERNSKERSQTV